MLRYLLAKIKNYPPSGIEPAKKVWLRERITTICTFRQNGYGTYLYVPVCSYPTMTFRGIFSLMEKSARNLPAKTTVKHNNLGLGRCKRYVLRGLLDGKNGFKSRRR